MQPHWFSKLTRQALMWGTVTAAVVSSLVTPWPSDVADTDSAAAATAKSPNEGDSS